MAGKLSTCGPKHDLHRNSVTEKHKTEFSHVKPKLEPIKMLDVFYA